MIDKIGKRFDGLYWPMYDSICYNWTKAEDWIPEFISTSCDNLNISKRSIIHAGGNVGKYALDFAKTFENVYVFEPDDLNFVCLSLNCAMIENIFPYKAALGAKNGTTTLINNMPNSCGNMQTTGSSGKIPVLTIDNLSLTDVSVIHLDVEGYELFILQGALQTIERCKPLLAFEITGAHADYGITSEDINNFMLQIGYNKSMQYGNEVMFYYET